MLIVAAASILSTVGVAGASVVLLFERQLLRYVEQDLNIHWTELATAFTLDSSGQPMLTQRLTDPRYSQPYGGAYWQVSEAGRPLLRSRSLWDKELAQEASRPDPDKAFEVEGPDGSELYVVDRDVTIDGPSGQRTFSLATALDHKQVVELQQAFGRDVALVLGPIALVLLLFACLQLWLGLHPLRRVVQELNAVQSGRIARMSRRIPVELAPLVDSLNRLLDRQETLIRKARDRAGALAHGLKTPLTVLNGEVRRLEKSGEKGAAARIDEQLASIRLHVDREVTRARTSGASVGGGAYTAVDATIARLVRLMQHLPRGDELAWDTRIPPDLAVEMDPHDFGEVLGNLLDNARKWARHRVTVSAVPAGLKARIVVEDDGPGFSAGAPGARPERGLTGRVEAGSSGLGLGIVEDVLSEYGTRPEIDGDGRVRIAFEVPLCREPRRSGEAGEGGADASLRRPGLPV